MITVLTSVKREPEAKLLCEANLMENNHNTILAAAAVGARVDSRSGELCSDSSSKAFGARWPSESEFMRNRRPKVSVREWVQLAKRLSVYTEHDRSLLDQLSNRTP